MDFQCYVGKYEIKRLDELPESARALERRRPPHFPFLVQVGPAKLVRPKLDHLRAAVGRLLQMPALDFSAAFEEWRRAVREGRDPQRPVDTDELSTLKKNALLIAHHIGMLHGGAPDTECDGITWEALDKWVDNARYIQNAFEVRGFESNRGRRVGKLEIFLANRGHRVSMHIRPRDTADALMYVAALEIARGATSQVCKKCGTPFLEGGERTGKKRRGGARFCSDKCRYAFHYDVRRKKS
jgi:hypothetical protein